MRSAPSTAAVATLARASTPTGRLWVPELDVDTAHDQLVPVEQGNWHARRVAGSTAPRYVPFTAPRPAGALGEPGRWRP